MPLKCIISPLILLACAEIHTQLNCVFVQQSVIISNIANESVCVFSSLCLIMRSTQPTKVVQCFPLDWQAIVVVQAAATMPMLMVVAALVAAVEAVTDFQQGKRHTDTDRPDV